MPECTFPSSLSNVRISSSQSSLTTCLRSTTSPLTLAEVATLARPSLISFVISSTDILPSYSLKDPSFNVIFIIIMSSLFIFISYPRACIFFPARSAIIRNLLLFSKRMASTGPATGHSLRTRGEKKPLTDNHCKGRVISRFHPV